MIPLIRLQIQSVKCMSRMELINILIYHMSCRRYIRKADYEDRPLKKRCFEHTLNTTHTHLWTRMRAAKASSWTLCQNTEGNQQRAAKRLISVSDFTLFLGKYLLAQIVFLLRPRTMTEQSTLLLRKQLAGNVKTRMDVNAVGKRATYIVANVSFCSYAKPCLRHRRELRKLTKQYNGIFSVQCLVNLLSFQCIRG